MALVRGPGDVSFRPPWSPDVGRCVRIGSPREHGAVSIRQRPLERDEEPDLTPEFAERLGCMGPPSNIHISAKARYEVMV
jgi:hypothetical protein